MTDYYYSTEGDWLRFEDTSDLARDDDISSLRSELGQ